MTRRDATRRVVVYNLLSCDVIFDGPSPSTPADAGRPPNWKRPTSEVETPNVIKRSCLFSPHNSLQRAPATIPVIPIFFELFKVYPSMRGKRPRTRSGRDTLGRMHRRSFLGRATPCTLVHPAAPTQSTGRPSTKHWA